MKPTGLTKRGRKSSELSSQPFMAACRNKSLGAELYQPKGPGAGKGWVKKKIQENTNFKDTQLTPDKVGKKVSKAQGNHCTIPNRDTPRQCQRKSEGET